MKPEQMYRQLKEVAEKLEIEVLEHGFPNTGISFRSGLCKVKGKDVFIMDKNLPVRGKIQILAECLSLKVHENLFLLPAVRDLFADLAGDKNERA